PYECDQSKSQLKKELPKKLQDNIEDFKYLQIIRTTTNRYNYDILENRQDSTVEDLKNKVDQLTEQLAAVKTESRRHARTSRCYKCGMPGHWRSQCPRTRPLVHNKIFEYSCFPGWVAISALTQATIQAVIEIDGKRELCLIDTGAGVSLRQRGNQAERRPCALAVRAVGGYRLQIDGLSMHSIRLGGKSVQHTFLISPDIEQIYEKTRYSHAASVVSTVTWVAEEIVSRNCHLGRRHSRNQSAHVTGVKR
ncbi:gap-Pol polyprotein, partial [Clonorchis sinensis]